MKKWENEQIFFKGRGANVQNQMKKFSKNMAINEMQIKTAL
jgi:hypothetical protein